MNQNYSSKILSNTYTEIIPYHKEEKKDSGWRDGMVTGNGQIGAVCSCSPYSDTIIYQDIDFIMPSKEPRVTPAEVTGELHEARQAVIHFDDSWNVNNRERTFLYAFHPAHQLRLSMSRHKILQYERQTDYETAEVSLKYTDVNGTWRRRTFSSREDSVTITQMTKSDQDRKIDVVISIDDPSSMCKFGTGDEINMQYKKLVDEDCSSISLLAHYPSYEGSELAEGGYAGVTRIITVGGNKKKILEADTQEAINVGMEKNPAIHITGADAVYLITSSARTHHMGKLQEFAKEQNFDILNDLLAKTEEIVRKYSNSRNGFSYEEALLPHGKKQSELYRSVKYSLGSAEGKELYNEELIAAQKASKMLLDSFVERAYNQGRYAQICCAGISAPRLCGLWTGEWNPGWRGAYTIDANVNIEVSGMNTGNIYDAGVGYIYFVLRQIKDWEENAFYTYGMHDALQPPVNTDGDVAIMVEYDQYFPFQYWNAGASWLLLPVYEFWQCFGNCTIPVIDRISSFSRKETLDLEKDILLPLLTKQANFWEQLCTPEYYTDVNGKACYQEGKKELYEGERYLILPSYSPENIPKNYRSTITANATMDISAARDGLKMVIELEKAVTREGYEVAVEKWETLMSKLPEYKYDSTGALREWAMEEYEENNEHRHISHLYCAWPAYEAQNNETLITACNTAIDNRNRENVGIDDTASHGWVHKALVAARLKNCKSVYEILYTLMSNDIYYTSMMTDHNTNREHKVYCTDTSIGTVGIINEMLVYSNSGEIEFLPALPKNWRMGSISGLMARTKVNIKSLQWDLDKGTVTARLHSYTDQTIKLACQIGKGFYVGEEFFENHNSIHLKKDYEIDIMIAL